MIFLAATVIKVSQKTAQYQKNLRRWTTGNGANDFRCKIRLDSANKN